MSSIISLVIWWLKRPNKSRASKSHRHQYKNNIHRTKQRRREQQTLTTSIMMLHVDSVISMVCRWRSPPALLIKNDLAECLNGKVPEVNNLKSTHVRINKTYVIHSLYISWFCLGLKRKKNVIVDHHTTLIGFIENEKKNTCYFIYIIWGENDNSHIDK